MLPLPANPHESLDEYMARCERVFICDSLIRNRFNVRRTAADIGRNRQAFYKMMERHGIVRPSKQHVAKVHDLRGFMSPPTSAAV